MTVSASTVRVPGEGGYMEVEATSSLNVEGRSYSMINESDLPSTVLSSDTQMREIAAQLTRWVDHARAATGRTSMFDRGIYAPPSNPYDEMRSARHAMRYDSIVSGVAEITEAFAFQGVKWEGEDPDDADVFNQLAADQNLDATVREMWREEFAHAQAVVTKLWGWQTYTVRGKTKNGNARKRTYRIWCPLQLRVIDSAKVVPVGLGPLGGETLAWQASQGEVGYYQTAYTGDIIDPLMTTFFQGTYNPAPDEAGELASMGVNISRLLAMNPDYVFRHTLTKPAYERFADIRLKSLFSVLDLKQQLMAADRAYLIGAAKYILLIRKGLANEPAMPEEMANLRENYNFIAKLPVIISDHRLQIDIIAPKTDMVLDEKKYQVLDSRILARLLGTMTVGSTGRSENQESLGTAVAKVMENRRHMLKRTLERQIGRAVVNHPRNANVFTSTPSLVYSPRNVSLSLDQSYVQALLALRTQREISRETILEFFGLDEATEAQRMELEAELYDDIFKTEIPYSAGSPAAGVDASLDKKDAPAAVTVAPDGTLMATPAKKTAAKAPAKVAPGKAVAPPAKKVAAKAPAKGPNGTPAAPAVTGGRGGRPIGGGVSKKSPAAIAKPRTSSGNPKVKR